MKRKDKKSPAPAPVASAPAPSPTPASDPHDPAAAAALLKKKGIQVPRTGDVDVQTRTEVAQEAYLIEAGKQIIHATGELANKYYNLIMGIRQQKIAPKLVSFALGKIGFARSRVAEINRISQASDKLFKDYEAKLLGFNKVLELARAESKGQPALLTDAATQLAKDGVLTEEELQGVVDEAEAGPESAAAAGASPSRKGQMKSLAHKLMAMAAKAGRPKYAYTLKDCPYTLEITRHEKTGPSVGDDGKE